MCFSRLKNPAGLSIKVNGSNSRSAASNVFEKTQTENAGDTSTANGKNLRGARLNAMKFKRMEITLNVVEGVVFTKRRKTTFPKYIQKMAKGLNLKCFTALADYNKMTKMQKGFAM